MMVRPLTPLQLAETTDDWEAIGGRPAVHLSADDDDPRWLRALRRLDDVLFGISETPWLDAACVACFAIVVALCLVAWLLP